MEENRQERDLEEEAARFREAYPQVTALTDRVTQAWAEGTPLTEAWERFGQEEREEEPREELHAPVAAVTGQGSVRQPRRDDFLSGLELNQW